MERSTRHDIKCVATDGEVYRIHTAKADIAIVIDGGEVQDNLFTILDGDYDEVIDVIIKNQKETHMKSEYEEKDVSDIYIADARYHNKFIYKTIRIEMKDGNIYEYIEQEQVIDDLIESVNNGMANHIGKITI